MTHEQRPSAESTGERDLFREQLHTLERSAGDGTYGKPIRFLAGLELEYQAFEDAQIVAAVDQYRQGLLPPERAEAAKKYKFVTPYASIPLRPLSPEERAQKEQHYRDEARQHISQLTPRNVVEAERQQRWLKNIDSFTATDIINFRLYRDFSRPTLAATAPAKGSLHPEMVTRSLQSGWLEFRFGSGVLQEGYYDNPDVSEVRLNPCSPTELIEREEIVKARLATIAAEHGIVIAAPGSHVNLSAYTQQYVNGRWEWAPIIGYDPDRQQKTLAAVSGLSAAIEDGAWMWEDKAKDRFLFGEMGKTKAWKITTHRDAIRIQNDYIELRESNLHTSTTHGLLWMMAGMTYGLEHGVRGIEQEGHAPAEVVQTVRAIRTEHFDKNIDLQLQRAVEQSTLNTSIGFALSDHYALQKGHKLMQSILGEDFTTKEVGSVFSSLLMSSLRVDEHGALAFDPETYWHVHKRAQDLYAQFPTAPDLECIGVEHVTAAAQNHLARDAVRIHFEGTIKANPTYPGLTPQAWLQRWQASPIMQRAYGTQTDAYARRLSEAAAQHYVEIDLSDPATFMSVMEELAQRSRDNIR